MNFNTKHSSPSNCIFTIPYATMSSLRIVRAAFRVRPAAIRTPIWRRGYADVAADKIKLSLALPHQVRIYSSHEFDDKNFELGGYTPLVAHLEALDTDRAWLSVYLQIHRCVRQPFARLATLS
jgi:hypothetical protein